MKVLGIDTATMMGSVGLIDDDRPVAQYSLSIEVTHSERLMETIDVLLRGVRIGLDGIDGFAVSTGPGSFTGLRIGLATVKGLCMATGKEAASVSTLEALALNMPYCSYSICPVLDARKKEVYSALFRYDEDGTLKRLTDDMVISPELLVEMIKGPVVFSGDGVYTYRDIFKRRLGSNAHFAPVNAMFPSGLSVAGLGLSKLKKGETMDKTGVPAYVRRSEAEIKFETRGTLL
ncbi:MAG: tRNA (adenosine(37)-N6)-threonylcarbamoyltransferase complex dimerization subunit type 1 TsaB [Nitrospirae bacterium GWA2_42_11]|nr:MAG: tRNA (adenosine(37)-N6)-threonylcarbamoyltransferase complex dimerization subunit type 1 TsaB [Nitrospirae bacterium GWA2_42_11]